MWNRGRDVRFRGSQVDQVMGGPDDAETQAVPLFEKGTSVVEFAPPEGIRPGQVGTLVDEVANTLDVSATIVDLAVRKYLVIQEIPKTWLLGKADWNLRLLPEPDGRQAPAVREEAAGRRCSRTAIRSSCRRFARRSPSACRRSRTRSTTTWSRASGSCGGPTAFGRYGW